MLNGNDESLDILGIKPVSDTIKTVAESAVKSTESLFNRICLPVAEEFGLYLKDKMRIYRITNITKIAIKAQKKIEAIYGENYILSAHPRIVNRIIENGSWNDDDEIENMWAGLLTSSCTQDGKDESNLIFINYLSQITSAQAKILKFACENGKININEGLIVPEVTEIDTSKLIDISGISDIHRLDRELDHLRSIGLILGGFDTLGKLELVDITPSALGLNMYVRCSGSKKSPPEFFNLIKGDEINNDGHVKET